MGTAGAGSRLIYLGGDLGGDGYGNFCDPASSEDGFVSFTDLAVSKSQLHHARRTRRTIREDGPRRVCSAAPLTPRSPPRGSVAGEAGGSVVRPTRLGPK